MYIYALVNLRCLLCRRNLMVLIIANSSIIYDSTFNIFLVMEKEGIMSKKLLDTTRN